ncbi:MAG TPA: alpha/beta hydrolase [Gemmatimonadaceae bacterium]|nr:alpha/beta hydrolase [Gemmatimonadaceae bacterium]
MTPDLFSKMASVFRFYVTGMAMAVALVPVLHGQAAELPGTTSQFVETNGIRMHVVVAGEGPLVVLAHGFPESSYSWRHQISILARAGYRVLAPDLRGYGATDRPAETERYNIFELVGDLVGLVRALGEREAVIVGHDWGAQLAAYASLLRPDIFRATVLLSVPYAPRSEGPQAPMEAAEAALPEGMTFYQLYFQQPGRAEAELEADVRRSLAMAFYSASGSAPPEHRWRPLFRTEDGVLSSVTMPETLPEWLAPEDLDVYARQFERSGFRPALNWYRNIDRNWRMSAFLTGARLEQPTLFIGGTVDPILAGGPGRDVYDRLEESVPGLTRKVLLEGKGHWIQQEAPGEVNRLLLEFLDSLKTDSSSGRT